jgi:hypothetical protein
VQVLLDVHETWYKNIDFIDIAHRDFKFYRGSWEIQENPKGLEITYNLTAQQNFEAPFAGDYMKGGVRDLLDAVRREILRCQALKLKEEAKDGISAPQALGSSTPAHSSN